MVLALTTLESTMACVIKSYGTIFVLLLGGKELGYESLKRVITALNDLRSQQLSVAVEPDRTLLQAQDLNRATKFLLQS